MVNDVDTAKEVMYAIRRTDGELIGDYSFLVTAGPNDWATVDEDNYEATEYEMVKLTVERVEVKTFGQPCCDKWEGKTTPEREWFDIIISSLGEDTWPARDHRFATAESEADAEIRVAMLPEVVTITDTYGAYEVRRDQFRIERRTLRAYRLDCEKCGHPSYDHDEDD